MAGRESDPYVLPYKAVHLRPLSPAFGRLVSVGAGTVLHWIRRTRQGGDSWTGLDVPLGEEAEFYKIEITDHNDQQSIYNADVPSLTLPNITIGDIRRVAIAQGSRAYGFGPPLIMTL